MELEGEGGGLERTGRGLTENKGTGKGFGRSWGHWEGSGPTWSSLRSVSPAASAFWSCRSRSWSGDPAGASPLDGNGPERDSA